MKRRGFSLLEVVLVVAIVAVLAGIAIPRVSRGAKGGSETALAADLRTFRDAIDLYVSDHNGLYPTEGDVAEQLTQYTDLGGDVQANRDASHRFGPYLRSVPRLPVGLKKGAIGIGKTNQANNPNMGWIYDEDTGVIRANCAATELDSRGIRYDSY